MCDEIYTKRRKFHKNKKIYFPDDSDEKIIINKNYLGDIHIKRDKTTFDSRFDNNSSLDHSNKYVFSYDHRSNRKHHFRHHEGRSYRPYDRHHINLANFPCKQPELDNHNNDFHNDQSQQSRGEHFIPIDKANQIYIKSPNNLSVPNQYDQYYNHKHHNYHNHKNHNYKYRNYRNHDNDTYKRSRRIIYRGKDRGRIINTNNINDINDIYTNGNTKNNFGYYDNNGNYVNNDNYINNNNYGNYGNYGNYNYNGNDYCCDDYYNDRNLIYPMNGYANQNPPNFNRVNNSYANNYYNINGYNYRNNSGNNLNYDKYFNGMNNLMNFRGMNYFVNSWNPGNLSMVGSPNYINYQDNQAVTENQINRNYLNYINSVQSNRQNRYLQYTNGLDDPNNFDNLSPDIRPYNYSSKSLQTVMLLLQSGTYGTNDIDLYIPFASTSSPTNNILPSNDPPYVNITLTGFYLLVGNIYITTASGGSIDIVLSSGVLTYSSPSSGPINFSTVIYINNQNGDTGFFLKPTNISATGTSINNSIITVSLVG